jgi:hypothetical protein
MSILGPDGQTSLLTSTLGILLSQQGCSCLVYNHSGCSNGRWCWKRCRGDDESESEVSRCTPPPLKMHTTSAKLQTIASASRDFAASRLAAANFFELSAAGGSIPNICIRSCVLPPACPGGGSASHPLSPLPRVRILESETSGDGRSWICWVVSSLDIRKWVEVT